MKTGLLGQKLEHSYSPLIHCCFGDGSYQLFSREPEELESFLRSGDFTGINVTIPYKKVVAKLCDELTETAQRLGAVNTVIRQNGRLIGHNTDYFGFQAMLRRSGLKVAGKKVLVLGSGGASVTVQTVLAEKGAQVVVVSRNGENNYHNLHLHAGAAVIVNCTPVGMYPNNGDSPVDLSAFPKLEGVLELIYNPARTKLLLDAQARGLITQNGLYMLVAQAKESSECFQERKLPDALIDTAYQEVLLKMMNIVLIGMPGSGKSTIAKLLGQKLCRDVIDTDDKIEQLAGRSIPQILRQEGEAGFRTLEAKALKLLGKQSGIIIATGGGCVTREENYEALAQNSLIIWLKRDLASLSSEGRPLSQCTSAEDMYKVRKPLYARFSQLTVRNDGCPEQTVQSIIQILQQGVPYEDISD